MKQSTKKHFKSLMALFMIVAVLIGGAFAYLTAQDSANNVFTVGKIDIELIEDGWADSDGDGDFEREDGTSVKILPGVAIDKAPYVKNTGKNPAWTFVTVGIPTTATPADGEGLQTYGANLDIPVEAYAIQDGYAELTGAEAIWNEYFKDRAQAKFGNKSTADVVELFSMDNLDTTNWIQLGTPFNSENGYMYYVFAYNGLLEVKDNSIEGSGETTKLFTTVTLNVDVTGTKAVRTQDILVRGTTYYSTFEIPAEQHNEYFGDKTMTYGGKINEIEAPADGDIYLTSDYEYRYNYAYTGSSDMGDNGWVTFETVKPLGYNVSNGWSVKVRDNTKTEYSDMLSTILGKPVISAHSAYANCESLVTAPALSDNLQVVDRMFADCELLTGTITLESENIANSKDMLEDVSNVQVVVSNETVKTLIESNCGGSNITVTVVGA